MNTHQNEIPQNSKSYIKLYLDQYLLRMNQISVNVSKCYINLSCEALYSINLKAGKSAAEVSNDKLCKNGVIEFNQQLSLIVPRISIQTNPKVGVYSTQIYLVIYMQRQSQQKKIIGIVNIKLDEASINQQSYTKYRVQQSPDRNAYLEAIVRMDRISNTKIEMESVLTIQKNKRTEDSPDKYLTDQNLSPKDLSPQKRFPQNVDYKKIEYYESIINQQQQQLNVLRQKLRQNNSPQKQMKALKKLQENNSFLKQVVSIEQKKNIVSNQFIIQMLNLLEIDANSIKLKESNLNGQKYEKANDSVPLEDFKGLMKDRDYLFQISSQLCLEVQGYKKAKQEHEKILKAKEQLCSDYQYQNQHLKYQIKLLQQRISNSSSVNNNLHKISEENQILKTQIKQLQRKFSETLKAVEQFRKDALKAREQIISKDIIINNQKYQLQQNQNTNHSISHLLSSQILKQSIQSRQDLVAQLNKITQSGSQLNQQLLSRLKDDLNSSYLRLLKGKITKQTILNHKNEIIRLIVQKMSGKK